MACPTIYVMLPIKIRGDHASKIFPILLSVQLALHFEHSLGISVTLIRWMRGSSLQLVLPHRNFETIWKHASAQCTQQAFYTSLMAGSYHIHIDEHVVLIETHFIAHVGKETSHSSGQMDYMSGVMGLEKGESFLKFPEVAVFTGHEYELCRMQSGCQKALQR